MRVKLYRGLKIHMATSAGIVKIGSSEENLKNMIFSFLLYTTGAIVKYQLMS